MCHLRVAFYKSLGSHLVWQAESHKNATHTQFAYVTMMNVWYVFVCYFYVHISFLFCSFLVYLIQAHGIQKQMMISEAYKLKTIIFAYHLNWGNAANDACSVRRFALPKTSTRRTKKKLAASCCSVLDRENWKNERTNETKSICVCSLFL